MAPEQIRGEELDGRADLYSLGCLLYECLAGRPPFGGSSDTAIVFAHLQEEPPALPGLEPVIRKALAKEPDERYQSGRELVVAARDALKPARSAAPLALRRARGGRCGGPERSAASSRTQGAHARGPAASGRSIALTPNAFNLIDARAQRHVVAGASPAVRQRVTDVVFSGRSAWLLLADGEPPRSASTWLREG